MKAQNKTKGTGAGGTTRAPKQKYVKPRIAEEERLVTQPLQLACKNPPGGLPPLCNPQTTPLTG